MVHVLVPKDDDFKLGYSIPFGNVTLAMVNQLHSGPHVVPGAQKQELMCSLSSSCASPYVYEEFSTSS